MRCGDYVYDAEFALEFKVLGQEKFNSGQVSINKRKRGNAGRDPPQYSHLTHQLVLFFSDHENQKWMHDHKHQYFEHQQRESASLLSQPTLLTEVLCHASKKPAKLFLGFGVFATLVALVS
jgi:hypothetical protein